MNIGTGEDISISDLAKIISRACKYDSKISFDLEQPDGTLRKLLDVSRLHKLGWKHSISLEEGVGMTCEWYKENEDSWKKM